MTAGPTVLVPRPTPSTVGDDVVKAQSLLLEGKHVRLNSEVEVSILIDKVARGGRAGQEGGRDAPDYNFCAITIPGTSLFCGENKGIKRDLMPQFGGQPVEGSFAEAKAEREGSRGQGQRHGRVRPVAQGDGHRRRREEMPVQNLKATQNELVGSKVAGIRAAMRKRA